MPLYDYVCQQCGRHTEKIQSFSAPPLTECPHCHGKLERAITAPAVQFKGAGWYVTDYSKSGSKAPASKGDAGSSGEAPAATPDSGAAAKSADAPASGKAAAPASTTSSAASD